MNYENMCCYYGEKIFRSNRIPYLFQQKFMTKTYFENFRIQENTRNRGLLLNYTQINYVLFCSASGKNTNLEMNLFFSLQWKQFFSGNSNFRQEYNTV